MKQKLEYNDLTNLLGLEEDADELKVYAAMLAYTLNYTTRNELIDAYKDMVGLSDDSDIKDWENDLISKFYRDFYPDSKPENAGMDIVKKWYSGEFVGSARAVKCDDSRAIPFLILNMSLRNIPGVITFENPKESYELTLLNNNTKSPFVLVSYTPESDREHTIYNEDMQMLMRDVVEYAE